MPHFKTAAVAEILSERPGLQKIAVTEQGNTQRAYVLTELTGPVQPNDNVIINTTAVDLDLGTGGWHFVHCNLNHPDVQLSGAGHIMKLRYTSLQHNTGSTEEAHPELADARSVLGMPVVACSLHSQLAGVVAGIATTRPELRIAFVMTDGAALPLVLSDLVHELREKSLLHATITAGQAFGGDFEAVNIPSALAIAKQVANADITVVGMGPGIVGTGTRLGTTGLELAQILDTGQSLNARPIACLRASSGDTRERHQGISHHALTALLQFTHSRVVIPIPQQLRTWDPKRLADLEKRHEVVTMETPEVAELFEKLDLNPSTMGRSFREDELLFACAIAAGIYGASVT